MRIKVGKKLSKHAAMILKYCICLQLFISLHEVMTKINNSPFILSKAIIVWQATIMIQITLN